jgi:hypothetical protein
MKNDLLPRDIRIVPSLHIHQSPRRLIPHPRQPQNAADHQPLERRMLDHVNIPTRLIQSNGPGNMRQLVGCMIEHPHRQRAPPHRHNHSGGHDVWI